ncbi:hypothetical protein FH5_04361 [Priestia endophytica]|nr:hypothetical protein FH5_04361 [Priestia endophytica]
MKELLNFCLTLTFFCLTSKKKGKRKSKETPTSSKNKEHF